MPSKHMSLPKTKLNFVVVKAPVKLCGRLSGVYIYKTMNLYGLIPEKLGK